MLDDSVNSRHVIVEWNMFGLVHQFLNGVCNSQYNLAMGNLVLANCIKNLPDMWSLGGRSHHVATVQDTTTKWNFYAEHLKSVKDGTGVKDF